MRQVRQQLRRRALLELLLSVAMAPRSATSSDFVDSAQAVLGFAVVDVTAAAPSPPSPPPSPQGPPSPPGASFAAFASSLQSEIGRCVREMEAVRQGLEGSIQVRLPGGGGKMAWAELDRTGQD